jgi:hypothetical protein
MRWGRSRRIRIRSCLASRGERPALTGEAAKPAVEYLELGGPEAPEYGFKALPCPKGRATHVLGPNTT